MVHPHRPESAKQLCGQFASPGSAPPAAEKRLVPGIGNGIVVPGNPDSVDTLEVEPSVCHPSFYFDGRSGSGAGLPSHSDRPSDGGARSSPSTQRFAALGEASEADRCGPISLGPAVAVLDRLAVCPGHRETGDGDCLAPQRGFACSGPGRCAAANRDDRLSPRKRGNSFAR